MNYAHGNMLTDEEFDLIAASRGTLSITPSTDMLMQFGTYPGTGRALTRSIVSGFGVDTICSAGTDLFSEMRLALAAERSRANAPALARGEQIQTLTSTRRDMLRLATLDGARVWNLDDHIGSLTPGKQADIAIIDMRSPHLDGFGDPVAVMVLGAGPADVETVIVGGDVVKRDGQLAGAQVDGPESSCTRPTTVSAAEPPSATIRKTLLCYGRETTATRKGDVVMTQDSDVGRTPSGRLLRWRRRMRGEVCAALLASTVVGRVSDRW